MPSFLLLVYVEAIGMNEQSSMPSFLAQAKKTKESVEAVGADELSSLPSFLC